MYSHCIKYGKEHLLREWDAEKNAPLTPQAVASTSTARVWWTCDKGHSWQTQLASRVRGSTGCPVCLRERIDARMERRRQERLDSRETQQNKRHS